MGMVIRKTVDNYGVYRVLRNVDVSKYPTADWEHDPVITNVATVIERYWKHDGTNTLVEMSQAEKDAVDAAFADKANTVQAGTMAFEKNNICRNKWLGFGSSKASNTTPYIVPSPIKITALTFVNSIDSVETDVEIYKNGVKIHTWELRNRRWAWKTQGLHALDFLPGDRIGIFLRDRGTDPRNVIVTLHYAAWNHEVGEGGSSTL